MNPPDDTRPAPGRLPAWLREPLLHFLVLGAALFAVDRALLEPEDDLLTIVISPEVDRENIALFKAARAREPDAAELKALRQAWVDNEVLYREGLALGMDRGDSAIRDRVIFKSLSVINAGLQRPNASDAELRAWFEQRRARYDEPPRFEFEEAVPTGRLDAATQQQLAERLNTVSAGEVDATLRVFKGRPRDNVVQAYGEAFAAALEAAPAGRWQVLQAMDGPRLVRLLGLSKGAPADYEALRNVLVQDWIDETLAQKRTDIVRGMAKRYRVVVAAESP
jgi:hypothetical protein